ncbi:MAG: radical SAM protein [Nitrospinae bacterium]|nr:radical SAM protein [Nitrospinota bacterium]
MKKFIPRLVFWEITKGCNLRCLHCRAVPEETLSKEEFSTEEAYKLIDEIVAFSNPILVLSGGEPLYRKDIFDIARYAISKGLRVSLATNGTLVDEEMAKRIADTGFARVSVSFDGAIAATHDKFRGIEGSFDKAISAMKFMRNAGVSTQINTTVAKHNYLELPQMIDLALELGVAALHTFLLVPVGCGVEIAEDQMLEAEKYEEVLNWFYDQSKKVDIDLKATCAPHYFRVLATRNRADKQSKSKEGLSAMTKGCLAGTGVCFVSNKGDIYPCGYLPLTAGNVRVTPFQKIWEESKLFEDLRNPELLTGKCGICNFKYICSGCRARAYAATGDFLSEEPFCHYEP